MYSNFFILIDSGSADWKIFKCSEFIERISKSQGDQNKIIKFFFICLMCFFIKTENQNLVNQVREKEREIQTRNDRNNELNNTVSQLQVEKLF